MQDVDQRKLRLSWTVCGAFLAVFIIALAFLAGSASGLGSVVARTGSAGGSGLPSSVSNSVSVATVAPCGSISVDQGPTEDQNVAARVVQDAVQSMDNSVNGDVAASDAADVYASSVPLARTSSKPADTHSSAPGNVGIVSSSSIAVQPDARRNSSASPYSVPRHLLIRALRLVDEAI